MSAMNNQGVGSEGKPIYLDQHGAAKATAPATSSSSVDTTNLNDNKLVTKGYVDKNTIIVTPTASYSAGTKLGNITVKDGANVEKANKDIFVPNATASQKGAIKTAMGADAVGTDANGDLKAVTVSKGGGSYAGDDDKLASKGYVDYKKTAVTVTPNATSGTLVGKIGVDGAEKSLYAPDQTPTAGSLISVTDTRKVNIKIDPSLVNANGTVKNVDFLGVSNDQLVAAKAPSVSIPGLDPNDLSNVVNFGVIDVFAYPSDSHPGTYEDGIWVKDLRSVNGLTIQLKYKGTSDGKIRDWHYFNLPTWSDGSTRFLYLTICFNAMQDSWVWMEADDGSKFYIDVVHGFESTSGSSSDDRSVINISLPIKSGVRIVCSPQKAGEWDADNLSKVVQLAHVAGFLIR